MCCIETLDLARGRTWLSVRRDIDACGISGIEGDAAGRGNQYKRRTRDLRDFSLGPHGASDTADKAMITPAMQNLIGKNEIVQAAVSEYVTAGTHVVTSPNEAAAMRAAVRGIMVRLNLYEDFVEALDRSKISDEDCTLRGHGIPVVSWPDLTSDELDPTVGKLQTENARLTALLEGRYKDVRLVSFLHGEMVLQGSLMEHMAAFLAEMLRGTDPDAVPANYTETSMHHPELGPLTLTLQRRFGKTPHTLRREAEEKLAALMARHSNEDIA